MVKKFYYFTFFALLALALSNFASAQWIPESYIGTGLPHESIYNIIYSFLFWLLAIFGMIALIGFAISGIMYLTSAGNDTQIESAKKAMKWSLVGVVVGLIGLVILFAVTNLLGGFSDF
jgi:hypothetical protein